MSKPKNSKDALEFIHRMDTLAIKKQKEEIERLKAEVERLKTVSTIEQRTIQGLQQTPEWSEIARLTAYCRELEEKTKHFDLFKSEVERLRSSSFVTAVPVEKYERLVKAGDNMSKKYLELWFIFNAESTSQHEPASITDWEEAKNA